MKILVLDQYGERGGAQNCLIDAVHGFRSRGWDVHALVPKGPLLDSLAAICATADPLAYAQLRCGRKTVQDMFAFGSYLLPHYFAVERVVRQHHIDVLYVNGPRLMPVAAMAHGPASVVFHSHNVVRQSAAAELLGIALRGCNAHVIASSKFVAAGLRGARRDRLRMVMNGVPAAACTERLVGRPFTVGMLSRIAPEKGTLEFALAARLVRRGIPGSRFVLGGDVLFGGDRAYADRVLSECGDGGVELAGWVDDSPEFLGKLDVLVVPSSADDATPRVVMEAFSAGVPVIAFDAGGLREIVRHGKDGVLIPPGNVKELAAQLEALAFAPDRLNQLGRGAYRRWLSDFTVDRYQEGVCEAVCTAASRRRHHRSPLRSAGASAEA